MNSFTDADRDIYVFTHLLEGMGAFNRNRFLEPENVVWFKGTSKSDGGWGIETSMAIDKYFDIRGDKIYLSDRSGLGVELDKDYMRAHVIEGYGG